VAQWQWQGGSGSGAVVVDGWQWHSGCDRVAVAQWQWMGGSVAGKVAVAVLAALQWQWLRGSGSIGSVAVCQCGSVTMTVAVWQYDAV
jgi:hypothetical protein